MLATKAVPCDRLACDFLGDLLAEEFRGHPAVRGVTLDEGGGGEDEGGFEVGGRYAVVDVLRGLFQNGFHRDRLGGHPGTVQGRQEFVPVQRLDLAVAFFDAVCGQLHILK